VNAQRWSHQIVEVKPQFLGTNKESIQVELDRMGNQGWELVSATQGSTFESVKLFFKRPA
jgi:hypothetical protein